MTHICVSKLTIIGSDNGLSPGRRQAIIWTSAGILLIRPLRTNFNEMLIEILTFSSMKMRLKVSSAKWRPFYLGLKVLTPVLDCKTRWDTFNFCDLVHLILEVWQHFPYPGGRWAKGSFDGFLGASSSMSASAACKRASTPWKMWTWVLTHWPLGNLNEILDM